MSVKNCIVRFQTSLSNLEIGMGDKKPTPEYIEQFQKNQIEFYKQLAALTNEDVQDQEDICDSLNDVIERIRKIESAFLLRLEKKNGLNLVKVLRSIANAFRCGEEKKALEEFKSYVPDGQGSSAGEVFGALWKVKKRPDYGDFGRLSFYNLSLQCVSTPFQKAYAVELAMVGVVCRAFEKEQIEQAHAEFNEFPYRMKESFFRLLGENDVELGRKRFFSLEGHFVETKTKIESLTTYQNNLEKIYSKALESDQIRLLQQDFKAALEGSDEKTNQHLHYDMMELLRTTHLTAFRALRNMQEKIKSHMANETKLTARIAELTCDVDAREQRITQLTKENLQWKWESDEKLNSCRKIEQVEEDFVHLEKPTTMEQFADFAHDRCPAYKIDDVKKFIEQGKFLVEKIQNGKAFSIPPEERKKEIAPLMWYMLYFAVSKNQGFSQGTIVFRDPGHAISKFFLECGKPAVYPRLSSHFKGRILPTFFEGAEQTTTYGIDIPQDNQNGLPVNKRTVNFSPIETKDGLDWSFLKPEDWGLGDMYQLVGHSWDYFTSRFAHLSGNPNGPGDRKEHILPETRHAFEEIYTEVVSEKTIPDTVKKFGIAGMKGVLEGMLNDQELSEEIKEKINEFLGVLRGKYDYLNIRNGHEAILGSSLILGSEPEAKLHESINGDSLGQEKLKDAQMRVKNAAHKNELLHGLSLLNGKPALNGTVQFVDVSNLDKNAIFIQILKEWFEHPHHGLFINQIPSAETHGNRDPTLTELFELVFDKETLAKIEGHMTINYDSKTAFVSARLI